VVLYIIFFKSKIPAKNYSLFFFCFEKFAALYYKLAESEAKQSTIDPGGTPTQV
jgi:hypothetical protein